MEMEGMNMSLIKSQREELKFYVASLARFIESRVIVDGWNAYLMTFMFHPVPGSEQVKLQTMKDAVYRFYATFLTRVIRKPKSPFFADKRPLLFAAPDYPVPKHEKQSLPDLFINDGLHFHGILVVPHESRLRQDVITLLQCHSAAYVKSPLRRIDAELIEDNFRFVTDYVFKSIKRNRFSRDDEIILPKARTEIGPTSELHEEMAKWCEAGLLPMVIPRIGPVSHPERTDTKTLPEFARSFRRHVTQSFERR
jgi:hypothetical protein